MRRLFIFLIILSFGVLVAFPILAVDLEVSYPALGPDGNIAPSNEGGVAVLNRPAVWVQYIFFLMLLLTGIAAVGSLIYAGIIWMTSGNTERIKDAQSRIKSAILGVIIVASSVLVLRIINEDLISLRQPSLDNVFSNTYNYFVGKSCTGEDAIACGTQGGVETFCHPGTGRCTFKVTAGQNCEEDIWCTSGFCNPGNNTCEAQSATICANDNQCQDGFFCDPSVFRCAPIPTGS